MYLQTLFPYAAHDQLSALVASHETAEAAVEVAYDMLQPNYYGLSYLQEQWKRLRNDQLTESERQTAFTGVSEVLEERARDTFREGSYANLSQTQEYRKTVALFAVDTGAWDELVLLRSRSLGDAMHAPLPLGDRDAVTSSTARSSRLPSRNTSPGSMPILQSSPGGAHSSSQRPPAPEDTALPPTISSRLQQQGVAPVGVAVTNVPPHTPPQSGSPASPLAPSSTTPLPPARSPPQQARDTSCFTDLNDEAPLAPIMRWAPPAMRVDTADSPEARQQQRQQLLTSPNQVFENPNFFISIVSSDTFLSPSDPKTSDPQIGDSAESFARLPAQLSCTCEPVPTNAPNEAPPRPSTLPPSMATVSAAKKKRREGAAHSAQRSHRSPLSLTGAACEPIERDVSVGSSVETHEPFVDEQDPSATAVTIPAMAEKRERRRPVMTTRPAVRTTVAKKGRGKTIATTSKTTTTIVAAAAATPLPAPLSVSVTVPSSPHSMQGLPDAMCVDSAVFSAESPQISHNVPTPSMPTLGTSSNLPAVLLPKPLVPSPSGSPQRMAERLQERLAKLRPWLQGSVTMGSGPLTADHPGGDPLGTCTVPKMATLSAPHSQDKSMNMTDDGARSDSGDPLCDGLAGGVTTGSASPSPQAGAAVEPVHFLNRERERWEAIHNLVKTYEGVFDYKGRCDLVAQIASNCPSFARVLPDLVPRVLRVLEKVLVGRVLVAPLEEKPLDIPFFSSKVFSCGPIKLSTLVFDTKKSSVVFDKDGERVRVKVVMKKLALEPLEFGYIKESEAARQTRVTNARRSTIGHYRSSSSRSGLLSQRQYYRKGVTYGELYASATSVRLVAMATVCLYSSGKMNITLDDVEVSIGSLRLSSNVTSLNMLCLIGKPFIKSALTSMVTEALTGTLPL